MAEEENVRRSQNPRLNLEAILCRMAFLEPMIPIEAVLARMEGWRGVSGAGRRRGARAVPEGNARRKTGGEAAARPGTSKMLAKSGTGGDAAAAYPANREMEANRGTGGEVSVAGGAAGSAARAGGEASQAGGRNGAPPGAGDTASATAAAEERAPYRSGAGTGGGGTAEKDWQGYKAFLKRQDPALSAKIESGRCLCCEPGRLRIGFEKGYLFLDDVVGRTAALAEHGRQFFGRGDGAGDRDACFGGRRFDKCSQWQRKRERPGGEEPADPGDPAGGAFPPARAEDPRHLSRGGGAGREDDRSPRAGGRLGAPVAPQPDAEDISPTRPPPED